MTAPSTPMSATVKSHAEGSDKPSGSTSMNMAKAPNVASSPCAKFATPVVLKISTIAMPSNA